MVYIESDFDEKYILTNLIEESCCSVVCFPNKHNIHVHNHIVLVNNQHCRILDTLYYKNKKDATLTIRLKDLNICSYDPVKIFLLYK